MIDVNQTIQEIANSSLTNEQALKVIGEIYLPAFLLLWLGGILLIFLISLVVLKKDFDKILLIAIVPLLILGVFVLLFTFILPVFPKLLGDLFSGMLQ